MSLIALKEEVTRTFLARIETIKDEAILNEILELLNCFGQKEPDSLLPPDKTEVITMFSELIKKVG